MEEFMALDTPLSNNTLDTPLVNNTKAEIAYQRIRNSILSGELAPNTKITISHVASKFGVSNIPVREAIKRLEAEGLVVITPYTGVYVAAFDEQLLEEVYPLRALLEGYAARLATGLRTTDDINRFQEHIDAMDQAIRSGDMAQMDRLNYNFHIDVYQVSGNQHLVRYIEDMWQKTALARIVFRFYPSRAETSNSEHKAIVDAIKKGDGELAERLVADQNQIDSLYDRPGRLRRVHFPSCNCRKFSITSDYHRCSLLCWRRH
jgi:DNA-binding GntR family transcriptional regulator